MINAKGLTKRFDEVTAVEGLDLDIPSGEVFGFLGPNGAGKTTTVRMLTGLIEPTSGTATVAGHDIGQDGQALRGKVGILTEAPGLYDRLSAERNLMFYAQMYGVEDPAAGVEKYLRMLGLWDRKADLAGTFSRGMRQKLAIARALLHEPQVVFLDEPTTGLDPHAARLVREFIEELKEQGRTILLATHNLNEADRLCDRVGVLSTSLQAVDTPAALRSELFGRTVVFHLASIDPSYERTLSALPSVQSVETSDMKLLVKVDDPENQNPELIAALVDAGARIQFVGELRRSLEDVYMQLVNEPQRDG